MRFRHVADTFAKLESGTRRLDAVDAVASLLGAAPHAELEPIVYLLQGQLRPPYEGIELGVGEKLLTRILAETYGATAAAVERRYKQRGDLGLVAESLCTTTPRARLSVHDAYEALLGVAHAAGSGSVARKTSLLVALLRHVDALEARYIVRIAQGRLRLGVGDQTILDAAAAGALGDRRHKSVIEHAYNVRSDLGGVVRLAYEKGASALERITPTIGIPVRPALAQRLPSAAAIIDRLGTVLAEPKYDGFRLQVHRDGNRIWAFSRRLENVSEMFPDLADGVRRQLRARRAIIEGEAVVHDPKSGHFLPFQVTMTRKRKYQVAEAVAHHPLRLFAFDLLYVDGRSYLDRSQRERHERLAELLPFGTHDPVAVTEELETHDPRQLQRYFDEMIHRGLEGVVAKRPDAPYGAGARRFTWVKLKRAYQSKLRDTVDLVLVGYLKGRGKRAALGIGSLLAAVYDPTGDRFRSVAKIGSGLSDTAWRDLRAMLDKQATPDRPPNVDSLITPDVWVAPKYVVEVLADEITRSPRHTCGKVGSAQGYALRFPRLVNGVRADKAPDEATTEREILDMYRMQGGGVTPRRRAPRTRARAPARRGGR